MSDLKYFSNNEPVCPHCDNQFDISNNEAWHLYDSQEEEKEVQCDSCGSTFFVQPICKFTFSTTKETTD